MPIPSLAFHPPRNLITEDYVAEHLLPDAITDFLFGDQNRLHAQVEGVVRVLAGIGVGQGP